MGYNTVSDSMRTVTKAEATSSYMVLQLLLVLINLIKTAGGSSASLQVCNTMLQDHGEL